MIEFLLYTSLSLIWGSTWLAIQYQVVHVPALWSLIYRFLVAGLLMLSACLITRTSLKFNMKEHGWVALQGMLLFCLNYCCFYLGSQYLVSGLMALLFANIIIVNLFTSYLLLGHRIEVFLLIAALLGIGGLSLVFLSEISVFKQTVATSAVNYPMLRGGCYGLMSAIFASLGTIVAARNRQSGFTFLPSNTLAMFYGTTLSTVIALVTRQPMHLDLSMSYLLALLYLVIVGTVLGFAIYITLVGRVGPARAGYVFVMAPIVSLVLSTYFENFHWTKLTFIGVTLTLVGNYCVMRHKNSHKSHCENGSKTPERP